MTHALLVAGLAAGLLTTPATDPGRVTETSPFGPQPIKTATATCPDGWVRYAGGGAVQYGPAGGTGVALTGVVPDEDGRSFTAIAAAPPGRPGSWAVTAVAICAESDETVHREAVHGTGSAVAECPSGGKLFGLGFHAQGRVTEVAINQSLDRVRVTTGGPAEVTAIALCRRLADDMGRVRVTAATTGLPYTIAAQESHPEARIYALGATVQGLPNAALDALVPGADDGTSWARVTQMTPAGAQRAMRSGGDEGSVTLEGARIATFH